MLEFITGTSTCTDLGSTTECIYDFVPAYASSTATTSTSTASVTDGEIAIVTMLFVLIVTLLTIHLISALSTVYKQRKYLQYGGGDVEVRKDL